MRRRLRQVRELASDVLMTPEQVQHTLTPMAKTYTSLTPPLSNGQAEQRTVYLAAAVFESLLEAALDESRRLNADRAEQLVRRAHALSKHPLLLLLPAAPSDAAAGASGLGGTVGQMVDVGVKMVSARLGAAPVVEMMRLLEGVRARLSGDPAAAAAAAAASGSGWGGSALVGVPAGGTDPQLLAFLAAVQAAFMREYAAGSMKRGYTSGGGGGGGGGR